MQENIIILNIICFVYYGLVDAKKFINSNLFFKKKEY